MPSRNLLIPAFLVAGLVCAASAEKPVSDQQPAAKAEKKVEESPRKKTNTLETFMRKKLDASSLILEGLCMEDADLVKKGADQLSEMSKVELWNVLTDATYREHSREFRDATSRVSEAAAAGDFDKAALRWFDVTMTCLECHNHVRGERKTEKKDSK